MDAQNWTPGPDDPLVRERIAADLPALLALARRLTGAEHDAHDALQDALERAWRSRAQLRDAHAAGAWLRTILARTVVDHHRSRSDIPLGGPEDLDVLLPDVDDPGALVAAAQDAATLRMALRALPTGDRVAIVLHDGEGWTAADVAQALGVSTDAAHKRIQRARARLLVALARGDHDVRPPGTGCADARAHAHAFLAGTLDDDTRAAVQAHLDTCPLCPATVQAAVGVLGALSTRAADAPLPPALRDQLLRLVDATTGRG